MRSLAIGLVVLAGCAEHAATPPPPAAPLVDDQDPAHCQQIAIDGSAGGSQDLGPWTLGATTICLHLDATHNRYAHFMAGTEDVDGVTSPFTLSLTDGAATIVTGWDVSVGQTATRTFENLELPIDGGTVRDLVLHVGTQPGMQAQTQLSVALFERLE